MRSWVTRGFSNGHYAARIAGSSVVELGAGDGTLLLTVAKRLGRQTDHVRAVLVDRRPSLSPETRAAFKAAGWHIDVRESDVFDMVDASPS